MTLAERLRDRAVMSYDSKLLNEAAARIEALERVVAEARRGAGGRPGLLDAIAALDRDETEVAL